MRTRRLPDCKLINSNFARSARLQEVGRLVTSQREKLVPGARPRIRIQQTNERTGIQLGRVQVELHLACTGRWTWARNAQRSVPRGFGCLGGKILDYDHVTIHG